MRRNVTITRMKRLRAGRVSVRVLQEYYVVAPRLRPWLAVGKARSDARAPDSWRSISIQPGPLRERFRHDPIGTSPTAVRRCRCRAPGSLSVASA
jgi:hypothetical protein